MDPNGILIRFDEIFLKRGRRGFFLDILDRNLRRALKPYPGLDVRRPHGRFLVQRRRTSEDRSGVRPPLPDVGRLVRSLSRVFGVASLSPIHVLPPGWESLQETLPPLVDQWLEERPARTFAVSARRTDKTFPLNSVGVGREAGALVLERHPELKVNLGEPELRVSLEIREEEIYAYRDTLPGPGGLPVGSNGKVMTLLSGGIDSPVAGWSILRRGVESEAVYFHSFPYTSEAAKEKVLALAREVGQWQGGITLHVVPFTDIQRACRDAAQARQLVLLYRRFMFRIAEQLARTAGAGALVTGESLGQVASQTLANLNCIERVVSMPVLRPLIANDKSDTIARAKEIGTYDISIQPFDDCCSLFVPKHPELRGRVHDLERAEERLDVEALVAAAIEATERIEL